MHRSSIPRRIRETRSSLFLILFSSFICVESYRIGLGTMSSPGPGLFPFCGGFILCILSLVEILNPSVDEGKLESGEAGGKYRVALVLLALTAYGVVLERLGFLLVTFS